MVALFFFFLRNLNDAKSNKKIRTWIYYQTNQKRKKKKEKNHSKTWNNTIFFYKFLYVKIFIINTISFIIISEINYYYC